jgi:hypothetical protein
MRRHRRKKIERRRLFFKVVLVRVIHFSDAGAHRIERLEWADQGTGRKNLDPDASPARGIDRLRQPN